MSSNRCYQWSEIIVSLHSLPEHREAITRLLDAYNDRSGIPDPIASLALLLCEPGSEVIIGGLWGAGVAATGPQRSRDQTLSNIPEWSRTAAGHVLPVFRVGQRAPNQRGFAPRFYPDRAIAIGNVACPHDLQPHPRQAGQAV